MGVFNSCWEAFLQMTAYAHMLGSGSHTGQQPLELPKHDAGSRFGLVPTAGVSFDVAGANFTCLYPSMTGYKACNDRSDRTCWLKGPDAKSKSYDIHTDYETMGPRGVTREYWLDVDLQAIAPDGYVKALGQVFNGSYPGPHIQACWGDELVLHITNKIPNLGTTVHWHGIRQLHTNQQDGVNGVTQCPIAPQQTYTYRFNLTQYGHTWYHSHYQTQYSDGVAGPLTIYGPNSADWDLTQTPIFLSDWTHQNTSVVFKQELTGGIPISDDILLGGVGQFQCADNDPLCCTSCSGQCAPGVDRQFCCTPDPRCFGADGKKHAGARFGLNFVPGKRYLLKLVNSAAEAMFIFSIDEHEFEVIAADLVPIQPYKTNSLFLGIGQRYQIIVTATPTKTSVDGNYWIRTRIADGCGTVSQDEERTGIVRYNASSTATPTTHKQHHRTECADEPFESLHPILTWNVSQLQNDISKFTFDADISTIVSHGAFRWDLTDSPLFLNYSNPTVLNTQNETYLNVSDYAIVDYPYNRGFVYLVIDGQDLPNLKRNISAAHPIHLHGHDFVILAQEDSKFNGTLPAFKFDNPPRRDVALLYSGGYLAMAFKPDNPGAWLVHCHIAWHASSGLALQILERQDDILPTIGSLAATQDTCKGWDDFDLQFNQDDSGI